MQLCLSSHYLCLWQHAAGLSLLNSPGSRISSRRLQPLLRITAQISLLEKAATTTTLHATQVTAASITAACLRAAAATTIPAAIQTTAALVTCASLRRAANTRTHHAMRARYARTTSALSTFSAAVGAVISRSCRNRQLNLYSQNAIRKVLVLVKGGGNWKGQLASVAGLRLKEARTTLTCAWSVSAP